jgi:hypothetical protein
MSNDVINKIIDDLLPIFQATDQALNEWTSEGNLQFPTLLASLAVKLNWDEKQIREADPLVRMYVRRHPDCYVTRGAHGGIMRRSERQKKEAIKDAAKAAKDILKQQIEAKATAAKVVIKSVDSE